MDANTVFLDLITPAGLNTSVFKRYRSNESDIFEQFTEEQKRVLMLYKLFAYCIGGLIILSNLVVVISSGLILKKGSQCKSTFLLLGNVSMADAIIGSNVVFGISVRHNAVSQAMCVFQIGLIVSPTLVSIYSVGLIAMDRYVYILHGLYYRRWVNTRRVRISILVTWIIGLSIGFMPATGWSQDTLGGRRCWFITLAPPSLIVFVSIVGVLPIVVVCILYAIILVHALRKVTQLRETEENGKRLQSKAPELRVNRSKTADVSYPVESRLSIHTISSSVDSVISESRGNKVQNAFKKLRQSLRIQKCNEVNKWRAITVVLLTTGSIVCTWVPYFITSIIYVLCDKEKEEERCWALEVALASPLAILGLLNSLLNPLIYAWWHRGFKNAVKKILCKFCRSCSCKEQNTS